MSSPKGKDSIRGIRLRVDDKNAQNFRFFREVVITEALNEKDEDEMFINKGLFAL